MKKRFTRRRSLSRSFKKTHLIRLFLCLTFFCCFILDGRADSRNGIVTMDVRSESLSSVLGRIKDLSGVQIIYNEELIVGMRCRDVSFRDKPVGEALEIVLQGSGLMCVKSDNVFVIRKSVQQVPTAVRVVGRVTDVAGDPVAGVTVTVKDAARTGTVTDALGNYVINLPVGSSVLVFSHVGMKTVEKRYAGEAMLNVVMEEAAADIEEVVVTGIFERRSGSFTGSATTFKADDLKRVGNTNVFQSLKNMDPSLMIFDNMEFGSDPNQKPKVVLHGESTFDFGTDDVDIKGTYGSDPNAPLFILDGFEASIQKVMDLDMERVASLTILKDASAKAIYGSRAANGVVVIETKRLEGEGVDVRITYASNLNLSFPDLTSYNLTNAAQKLELEKDAGLYEDKRGVPNNQLLLDEKYNHKYTAIVAGVDTDWLSKPLRNGVGQRHSLQLELSRDVLQVLVNASYNDVVGVMKGSDRVTYNGTINISYRHKKFNFRNTLSVTGNTADDSPYGTFSEYAYMNPYYSPYDRNGLLIANAAQSIDGTEESEFVANPLYNARLNTKIQKKYLDVTSNLYVEWNIIRGMTATLRMGIAEKRTSADEFYPSNHLKFHHYPDNEFFRRGSFQMNTGTEERLSGDINLRYSRLWNNKHYVFGNIGMNLKQSTYEEIVHKAEGFPNDRMNDIIFARQYVKNSKPTGRESDIRDVGILSAFNYSYADRYLLDLSWQTSASSQFGANNRWGQFWSVGLGWNIHKENFMKGNEWLTNAKLRGSVGHTGSESRDAYGSMATYIYNLDRTYTGFMGGYLRGMQNRDLKWQRELGLNVGMDVNIMRRLIVKIDIYKKMTDNTLINLTLPPSVGFSSVRENVGEVVNKGFDVQFSYILFQNAKERSFLTLVANISRNRNRIGKLSDAMKVYNETQMSNSSDRFSNSPAQLYYDGVSMSAIWGMRSLGIDPANGREIYLTRNGVPTYNFSAAEQMILGDALPKARGNAGVNFEWRGFGGNLTFRYQWGGQMYNTTLLNKVENADIRKNVDMRLYEGVWRKPGDMKPYKALADVWIAETQEYRREMTRPTSRFVQDRNELTLGNLSLYYDFYRCKWLRKAGMERLKFSFYMNDVFTLSSIEVERGTSYPFARTFNFSLTATF